MLNSRSDYHAAGTVPYVLNLLDLGLLQDDQPMPGRKYRTLSSTAYLPANGDGRVALRLITDVFNSKRLFRIQKSDNDDADLDDIVPDGVELKLNPTGRYGLTFYQKSDLLTSMRV